MTGEAGLLRVLSLAEGFEGALRLADYLPRLSLEAQRRDKTREEIRQWLRDSLAEKYDLAVLSPEARAETSQTDLRDLIENIAAKVPRVVLLMDRNSTPAWDLPENVEVLLHPDLTPTGSTTPRQTGRSGLRDRITGLLPDRWRRRLDNPRAATAARQEQGRKPKADLQLILVQPLAGGCGATTLSANLASEIAANNPDIRVLLIDLDLQMGTLGAWFDLDDDPRITDALSNIPRLDTEVFASCLQQVQPNLEVLQAPAEIVPFEVVDSESLIRVLNLARARADVIILDMPKAILEWSGAAWKVADMILLPGVLDVRSSQNLRRLRQLGGSAGLAEARLRVLLNHQPARPSRQHSTSLGALRDSLKGIQFDVLPDGGSAVAEALAIGLPIARHDAANPLARAIASLAREFASRLPRPKPARDMKSRSKD